MDPTSRDAIAFLFPAFPVLHQTFVLWEVLALRRLGVEIELYSIKRPGRGTQQPEGAALASEVHYLARATSWPVLAANLSVLRRQPRRYVGAYAGIVREWWRDRGAGRAWQKRVTGKDAPQRQLT